LVMKRRLCSTLNLDFMLLRMLMSLLGAKAYLPFVRQNVLFCAAF
jgi:hypothetical protein